MKRKRKWQDPIIMGGKRELKRLCKRLSIEQPSSLPLVGKIEKSDLHINEKITLLRRIDRLPSEFSWVQKDFERFLSLRNPEI